MIRSQLKKIKPLVRLYKRLKGSKKSENHEVRIVMDRETKVWIDLLDIKNMEVLEISGRKWKDLNSISYTDLNYPDFDICSERTEKKFDLIIAEQVFEHVLYPYKAGKNVYEMIKSGGYFLITTPFLLRIHECPNDCTRWTPTGIKHFLHECGFELMDIEVNSWGNKASVKANLTNWRTYNPIFHSLKNQKEFPVVVWALAKKR